jgi:hypothetical protein
MTTLTNILLAQTAEFKSAFIAKTQAFAEREFTRAYEISKWPLEKWCAFFGIEPEVGQYYTGETYLKFPKNFYNTYHAKTYSQMNVKSGQIIRQGRDGYVANQIQNAERHYIQSIEKLSARVEAKELNIESIEVTSGFQGVNFECTITDGIKKVRAFTIIAEGEIVRPHYRYLIK